MFSISAMSPPSTPRGSVFSPRPSTAWTMRALTIDIPEKRFKLDAPPSLGKVSMSPCGPNKSVFVRTSTLAARRQKRTLPGIAPLQLAQSNGVQGLSTGLSPIVKGLSLASCCSTPRPATNATPVASPFRLQKTAPTKKSRAPCVPKLSLGPEAAASDSSALSLDSQAPATATITGMGAKRQRRPPMLSVRTGSDSTLLETAAPLSPSVPQTPGISAMGFGITSSPNAAAASLTGHLLFGEASPSFYAQRTPPTASWAPTLFVTPPSPEAVVASSKSVAGGSVSGASALAPCTPPWPKTGASMQKTIFDHIGKSQLSPMDMRGYLAIAMGS
ncbi:hypothetical protein GGI07_001777 [Coemansia sp. Benny D115]|nr:hypothetical protein GGI07_001777 [Coemansia sp. Benny D115]